MGYGGGSSAVAGVTSLANLTGALTALDVRKALFPVWRRVGVVLHGYGANDSALAIEPFVLIDTDPQVDWSALGAQPASVFKMWYTAGTGPHIKYAESLDGVHWIRYSATAVIANHAGFCCVKVAGTYHGYCTDGTNIDHYTSPDGVVWTLAHNNVLTPGAAGAWDSLTLQNSFVIYENATYKIWYEATKAGVGAGIGLATSPDGHTFTKHASNPLIGGSGVVQPGGPCVLKNGSTYYMWIHYNEGGTTSVLPTDVWRFTSPDGIVWTKSPNAAVFSRRTHDEGVGMDVGQTSDPHLVAVGNRMYLYYEGLQDGNDTAKPSSIKLAIADMTLAQLVATNEGDADIDFHAVNEREMMGDTVPFDAAARLGDPLHGWAAAYISSLVQAYLYFAVNGDLTTPGPFMQANGTHAIRIFHQDGVTSGALEFGGTTGRITGQRTDVSTVATAILPNDYGFGGLAIVRGDSGSDLFLDVVLYGDTTVTVIASRTSGAPAARTYTAVASQLKLAMASGSYTIRAGYFAE